MGHSIKRLLLKLQVFLLPFLAWVLIDAFVLPPNFFTFRSWEALSVKRFSPLLTGPFYPNQSIEAVEMGELAPHTDFAVPRKATWITDRYGYRNRPSNQKPEVVILGDSFTAGIKLDQNELLSEQLAQKLGVPVYALAPALAGYAHIDIFLATDRFIKSPPRVVILQIVERHVLEPTPVTTDAIERLRGIYHNSTRLSAAPLEQAAITADRVYKHNWYHWIVSGMDQLIAPAKPKIYGGEAFFLGEEAKKDAEDEKIEQTVRILKGYRDTLHSLGADFIFMPVPDKETTYYDLLPSRKKPIVLKKLLGRLTREGVQVIELEPSFDLAYRNGRKLYPVDDNHWNPLGVQIAVEKLASTIAQLRNNVVTKPAAPTKMVRMQ